MATIEIGGIGKVDIPDNVMWASEDTQIRIESLLKGTGRGAQTGIFGQATKSSKGLSKNLNVMGTSITKISPVLGAVEAGFNALGSAVSGAAGLVAGIFESTGRFSDLNPMVDLATKTFTDLVGTVPIVGGFIAGLAQGSAEMLKLRLGLMDLQADTFETLALSGAKLDMNFTTLIGNILKSNIPLNQFNEIVRENTAGILAFGGNTERAFNRFNTNINDLTRLDSPIGMGLRTLGLGATEIADYFAEFIQNNRFSSKVTSLQNSELQQILAERIKDERVITEITGIKADEQRAAQREIATQGAFVAALRDFPAETQIALKDYISKLQAVDPQAAKLAMEEVAFRGIVSDQSGRFTALMPNLSKSIQTSVNLIKGGNTDVAAQMLDFSLSAKQFATSTRAADLAILNLVDGGQEIGNTVESMLLFGLQMDAQQKSLSIIGDSLGQSFGSLSEGLDAIETQYDKQIKAIGKEVQGRDDIAKMSPEDQTKFLQEALEKATGIQDAQTLNLIAARAGFENLVSDFQAQTFEKIMGNFDGLSEAIKDVTILFNDMLTRGGFYERFSDKELENERKKIEEGIDTIGKEKVGIYENQYGGPISSGMLSMVGEAGPELMRFGRSGEIINNATTNDIMSAASGIVQAMQEVKEYGQPVTETAVQAMVKANNPLATAQGTTLEDINNTLRTIASIDQQTLRQIQRQTKFEY